MEQHILMLRGGGNVTYIQENHYVTRKWPVSNPTVLQAVTCGSNQFFYD